VDRERLAVAIGFRDQVAEKGAPDAVVAVTRAEERCRRCGSHPRAVDV